MAFVYKAERKIDLCKSENNDIGPGEYLNEISLVKDPEKGSYQFQSKIQRDKNSYLTLKSEGPSPGEYFKTYSRVFDIFYHNSNKKEMNKDIYEAIKKNIIPKDMLNFFRKREYPAFNTKAGRFTYALEEIEEKKNLPGPCSYDPVVTHSFLAMSLPKNNKFKTSKNPNLNKGIKFTEFASTNTDMRIETIPSKQNYGYILKKDGQISMMPDPYSENKLTGQKNDSVGPAEYEVRPKWEKNAIEWIKTKDETDPKYSKILEQKKSKKISQLEEDYIKSKKLESEIINQSKSTKDESKDLTRNKSNQTGVTIMDSIFVNKKSNISSVSSTNGNVDKNFGSNYYTNNTLNSTSFSRNNGNNTHNNFNSKNALFKYFSNLRYKTFKAIRDKKENERDYLFETEPGPGYYTNEQLNFIPEKLLRDNPVVSFDTTAKRFEKEVNEPSNVGPGFYEGMSKPKEKPNKNIYKGELHSFNKDLEREECGLMLSLKKTSGPDPGPASYTIPYSLIKKSASNNNSSFGSNIDRFGYVKKESIKDNIKKDLINNGKENQSKSSDKSKKMFNYKKANIYTDAKLDLDKLNNRISNNLIPKTTCTTPGVGTYNPNVVSSIDYKINSHINNFVDKKKVGFGIQETKFNNPGIFKLGEFLGPGRYFKSHNSFGNIKSSQNAAPFNKGDPRFHYKIDKENLGPGTYELGCFEDWNKKSHNILFA